MVVVAVVGEDEEAWRRRAGSCGTGRSGWRCGFIFFFFLTTERKGEREFLVSCNVYLFLFLSFDKYLVRAFGCLLTLEGRGKAKDIERCFGASFRRIT